jgi:hypothetical protein
MMMQNKHGLRFTIPFRRAGYVGKIWNSSSVALTNKPQIDSIQQLKAEPKRRVMSGLGLGCVKTSWRGDPIE